MIWYCTDNVLLSHIIYLTVVEFVSFPPLDRFYWTVHYLGLVIALMGFGSFWAERCVDIRPSSSMYLQQEEAELVTFCYNRKQGKYSYLP